MRNPAFRIYAKNKGIDQLCNLHGNRAAEQGFVFAT